MSVRRSARTNRRKTSYGAILARRALIAAEYTEYGLEYELRTAKSMAHDANQCSEFEAELDLILRERQAQQAA